MELKNSGLDFSPLDSLRPLWMGGVLREPALFQASCFLEFQILFILSEVTPRRNHTRNPEGPNKKACHSFQNDTPFPEEKRFTAAPNKPFYNLADAQNAVQRAEAILGPIAVRIRIQSPNAVDDKLVLVDSRG